MSMDEAADNAIGDLWVKGPSIAIGYWNNAEATQRTFINGWLHTGDKYLRDTDGYYHYAVVLTTCSRLVAYGSRPMKSKGC